MKAYNRSTALAERQPDGTMIYRPIQYRLVLNENELRMMAIRAAKNVTHKCQRGPLTVFAEFVERE